MPWNEILDQSDVISILRGVVATQRIAHAYLFHGPPGVGKRAVALEFARTLQCETEADEACGTCRPCDKVKRLIHPDVQVLLPQPSDASLEDVQARLQRLAEQPYAVVDFVRRPSLNDPGVASNKQAFYHVARIKEELWPSLHYNPVEGRYQIVIMIDADLLRVEAANAFLKLLEEPGPRTIFILTSNRPDLMLPTILSRCQRVGFTMLELESIEHALREQVGVEASRAAILARMAGGSFSRARELAENEDLMGDRALLVDFLRQSYVMNIGKQADLIEQVSRMGTERVRGILGLMINWLRDLMLYRIMGQEAQLINVDQTQTVSRFVGNLPNADVDAMVSLVEDALRLVESNVNIRLVLTALSQSLGHAMRAPHSGELYVSLAS